MTDTQSHEAPIHSATELPVFQPSKLIGRDALLGRTYKQVKETDHVLIYGPAGIGKTALSAALASAFTERAGGSIWLRVHEPTLNDLVAALGRAYGIRAVMESENPSALAHQVADRLQEEQPLIVIDGHFSAEPVQAFIDECCEGIGVLLAHEEALSGSWSTIPVSRLEPDQSATLFRHEAGMMSRDQDADILALVERLGHSPLAIRIASSAIKRSQETVAEFVQALPTLNNANVNPVMLVISLSFQKLSKAEQGLILILGALFHGEASAELIAKIGGAPEDKIVGLMNELVRLDFAEKFERYGKSYYALHPTVHLFARTWLRGQGRLDTLQQQAFDTILNYAKDHSSGSDQGFDALASEMSNFLAASKWASDQDKRSDVNPLVVALSQAGDFVNERGYVHELLQIRRLTSSSTSAFPAHTASATSEASVISPVVDALEPELTEEDSVEILEGDDEFIDGLDNDDLESDINLDTDGDGIDDVLPMMDVTQSSEPIMEETSEINDIEDEFLDALDGIDDEDDEEDDDESLKLIIDPLDDLDDEDEFLDDALPDSTPLSESSPISSLSPLVSALSSSPSDTAEIARLRAEFNQARQQNDRRKLAEILVSIGHAQEKAHIDNESITSYSEALNLYESLNDIPGMLVCLESLAKVTLKTENTQAAVLHASRGVALAQQSGSEINHLRLLALLGDARQQLGETQASITAYQQALGLTRATEDKRNEALMLFKIGYAQLDEGEASASIQTWESALTLFREQSRRDYEGRILGGLGTAYGELDRWTEAISFHSSALHIAREVHDPEEEQLQLGNLGYAYMRAHESKQPTPGQSNPLGQAVLCYRQALHLAFESGIASEIANTTVDLVRLLIESSRHIKIADMLVESALAIDPTNRDLKRLQERIEDELEALGDSVNYIPVQGTAEQYAEMAYSLL